MTVYLVGAGPGDPGLLTRRGAALLSRADVVLHDRLVSPAVLDLVPPDAELIDVGKDPDARDGGAARQDEIARLLIEHGRRAAIVVRLKGGDPFLFGRGGEEVAALSQAGIPWEVVPGVTSAFGVPAAAGIPVTQRGLASSVTVVTGRVGDPAGSGATDGPDWESLARAGGTAGHPHGHVDPRRHRGRAGTRRSLARDTRGGDRPRHHAGTARGADDAGGPGRGGPRATGGDRGRAGGRARGACRWEARRRCRRWGRRPRRGTARRAHRGRHPVGPPRRRAAGRARACRRAGDRARADQADRPG